MPRYKVLKSVAHNVGDSFTSLMNYEKDGYIMSELFALARDSGEKMLLVDLLTGEATPAELVSANVRSAVDRSVAWLREDVDRQRTAMAFIQSAKMTVGCDPAAHLPARFVRGGVDSPYVCRVTIVDDRGKQWTAEKKGLWFMGYTRLAGIRVRWSDQLSRALAWMLGWFFADIRTARKGRQ